MVFIYVHRWIFAYMSVEREGCVYMHSCVFSMCVEIHVETRKFQCSCIRLESDAGSVLL